MVVNGVGVAASVDQNEGTQRYVTPAELNWKEEGVHSGQLTWKGETFTVFWAENKDGSIYMLGRPGIDGIPELFNGNEFVSIFDITLETLIQQETHSKDNLPIVDKRQVTTQEAIITFKMTPERVEKIRNHIDTHLSFSLKYETGSEPVVTVGGETYIGTELVPNETLPGDLPADLTEKPPVKPPVETPDGLSTGEIAMIVSGSVVGVALLAGLFVVWNSKRKAKKNV